MRSRPTEPSVLANRLAIWETPVGSPPRRSGRGASVILLSLLGFGMIGPLAGCSAESSLAPIADSAAEAVEAEPVLPDGASEAVADEVEVGIEMEPVADAIGRVNTDSFGAETSADPGRAGVGRAGAVNIIAASDPPAVLDRVVAIGASVTAGFGTRVFVRQERGIVTIPVGLGEAVGAAMPGVGRATTAGDLGFFAAPDEVGRRTLQRAVADEATLIVALDWLFWFAYGNTGHANGTEADIAARGQRVAAALERLETVETPMVVGDIPDMSAAAGGMLRRSQVCPEPTRQELNARIRAWASGRPNVTVVPLSELAAGLRDGELYGAPEGSALLKQDRLHTTVDGLVVLARAVADAIDAARDDVGPEHLVDDHRAIIDRLRTIPPR